MALFMQVVAGDATTLSRIVGVYELGATCISESLHSCLDSTLWYMGSGGLISGAAGQVVWSLVQDIVNKAV